MHNQTNIIGGQAIKSSYPELQVGSSSLTAIDKSQTDLHLDQLQSDIFRLENTVSAIVKAFFPALRANDTKPALGVGSAIPQLLSDTPLTERMQSLHFSLSNLITALDQIANSSAL